MTYRERGESAIICDGLEDRICKLGMIVINSFYL